MPNIFLFRKQIDPSFLNRLTKQEKNITFVSDKNEQEKKLFFSSHIKHLDYEP